MKYSFDTSAFINPWRNLYPIKVFPSLWGELDRLMNQGDLVATEMVLHELEHKDDELLQYMRQRDFIFIAVDEEQLESVAEILGLFPRFARADATREVADVFVVALAQKHNLVVVSDEQLPRRGKVKIPEVCSQFGVECVTFLAFLGDIGLVL